MTKAAMLSGRRAVVLGASAEGGTGWCVAEALAAEGATVMVAARTEAGIERLARRINGEYLRCDASKEEDVAKLADTAAQRLGKVDVAVNCAFLPTLSLIESVTDELLQASMQTNFAANVYFLKHMARAIGRDGSIILFSSLSSKRPIFPHAIYASMKAATDCLVRYAAAEFGPRNILVNSILPGAIETPASKPLLDLPGARESILSEVPLKRLATGLDYGAAVVWLASGKAFMTGCNLDISGGNQLAQQRYPDIPTPAGS
jgi:NAD(P)-dependent dehydrogenase (short-subunit alcohol dehydrogenase family)